MQPQMMENSSTAITAADALAKIHATLRKLAGPSGLAIVPSESTRSRPNSAKDNVSSSHEADLHPLSRVPLGHSRRQLSAALHALKAAAIARESWDAERSDRLLRVKRDTVVKQKIMKSSKNALMRCKQLAITADPFATPVALSIQRLRALAEDTGATTTEDFIHTDVTISHPQQGSIVQKRKDCLLTVCGTKFLADFHFFDVTATEVKVKVKFRHLTAGDNEVSDEIVDSDFANLVEQQDFTSLRKAFGRLIEQERLGNAIQPAIPLTDALRSFEDDLLAAQVIEIESGLSEENRLSFGHGLILRSALGLKIKFMTDHSALLGIEDARPPREISTGRAHPTIRQESHGNPMPSLDFAEGLVARIGAQYVLSFQTPIMVCLSVAQNLEKVGGLSEDVLLAANIQNSQKANGSNAESFSSRGEVNMDEDSTQKGSWPSLQKLLAPIIFGGHLQIDQDQSSNYGNSGSLRPNEGEEMVKKRSHWSQQAPEYIAAALLPEDQYIEFSHSGVDVTSGLAVHRVPLCHPRNVKPIFALVRQQIVFNELFKSCFGEPISSKSHLTPFQPQPVEVVIYDSPSFMLFNLYDEAIEDILSMAVAIELGGDMSVTVKSSNGTAHVCSDAKATAILRASRSVPLTIRAIMKMGSGATVTHK